MIIFVITVFVNHFYLYKEYLHLNNNTPLLYNSVLKIEPSCSHLDKNFQNRLAIKIEPGGEEINAIGVKLNYDPQKVDIIDIIQSDSICRQDMFIEKSIDEQSGQVTISCVLPNFKLASKEATVAELVIQPRQIGEFNIKFDEQSQVLANDGLGTNVLRTTIDGCYTSEDFTNIKSSNGLPLLTISSTSHPNRNNWYSKKDISFSWDIHQGYEYEYLLNQLPNSTPDNGQTIADKNIRLSVIDDGIYYFHIRAVKDGLAGSTSHFKIQIDSSPPTFIEKYASAKNIESGEVVRVVFESQDELSGVQSYYVKIDNGIFLPVASPLYIPLKDSGEHIITIKAFDNANNFVDSPIKIKVKGDNFWKNIINIDLSSWF